MKQFLTIIFFLVSSLYIGLQAQVVWPGDVNNNGIVNGVDVLYWGSAFGAAGSPRGEISEEWQAFPLPTSWSQNFPNGLNYAYADCNGDGLVDEDDFDKAISDNYGEIHGSISSDDFANASANVSAPKLMLETNTPVVLPGAIVNIDLSLSPSGQSTENFYGIAFSLKYEPDLLEGDDGPDFDLAENNWISADNSYVQELFVDNKGDGTAMLAITRTDQQAIPIQASSIGAFSIVIENIIFFERDTFTLEIDSVRLIGDGFQTIPTITNKIDIIVTTDTTSTRDSSSVVVTSIDELDDDADETIIFPNPVQDQFFIQASDSIEEIVLYDQVGRMVPVEYVASDNHLYVVRCQAMSAGVYWVQMRRNNRISTKRIISLNKN